MKAKHKNEIRELQKKLVLAEYQNCKLREEILKLLEINAEKPGWWQKWYYEMFG